MFVPMVDQHPCFGSFLYELGPRGTKETAYSTSSILTFHCSNLSYGSWVWPTHQWAPGPRP